MALNPGESLQYSLSTGDNFTIRNAGIKPARYEVSFPDGTKFSMVLGINQSFKLTIGRMEPSVGIFDAEEDTSIGLVTD